jgi:DNA-binding CsgD family transcriptional regulator
LDEPEREQLARAAAHVATALRLRLGQGATEAVLSPDGQVQDARGEARDVDWREALRFAARTLDRARSRARHEPEQALETWRALVEGRWSLVERFDTDGRRLWIARENEPPATGERGLTELEQRVVGFLVLGHAQKLIAYELGLSEGNISRQVSSACRKLGVSRAELVELYTTLMGGGSAEAVSDCCCV